MKLFQFKTAWFVDGRSQPFAIKASRQWVEKFIPQAEFAALFGGYVIWRKPDSPGPDMPGEAIGVWGRRNLSRFRRTLRERGAEFVLVNEEGPKQVLKVQSTVRR